MGSHWTEIEDNILREKYPECDWDELLTIFLGRTVSGIHGRAHLLRIKRSDAYLQRLADESRKHPKSAPRQPKEPVKKPPIKLYKFERRIIQDYGKDFSITELQMLMPRRSRKELNEIAEMFGLGVLESA